MSTAVLKEPKSRPAALSIPDDVGGLHGSTTTKSSTPIQGKSKRRPANSVVLHDIDWRGYVQISDAIDDRPGIRMTYDRGILEIMTLSATHERYIECLSDIVKAMMVYLNIQFGSRRSMTFRRKRLKRGFEPDHCFWIANLAALRAASESDLESFPAPDLQLEAEHVRKVRRRMGIFAAFYVKEVWRYDGNRIRVFLLGDDREYLEVAESPTFPGVPITGLQQFADMIETEGLGAAIQALQSWLAALNRQEVD